MSAFALTEAVDRPMRVIQVGAGAMGREWIKTLLVAPDAELVGLVDLNLDSATNAAHELGATGVKFSNSLTDMLDSTPADIVLNVTLPNAHRAVSTEAMRRGLPVLSEKPLASSMAEGLSIAAASEVTGQLLMVSQSRRYDSNLINYRSRIAGLGPIGFLSEEFFAAPRFGGFRDEMSSPLLTDMSVHHFDAVRYLLDSRPVSVYCESFNPPWSWFAGDAATTAVFEFEGGTRFQYTGSWCSPGYETSWNGHWRASTERGTVLWNGEQEITSDLDEGTPPLVEIHDPNSPQQINGSLAEFVGALRTGVTPYGEVHRNLESLAMVEAAILSAKRKERVLISDVIHAGATRAAESEDDLEVRAVLERWSQDLSTLRLA